MMRKLFERCVGWVTLSKDRFFSDPFVTAQLKLIVLFFLVGSVLSVGITDVLDHFYNQSISTISSLDTTAPVHSFFVSIEQSFWFWRVVKLLLIAIVSYFAVTYAFRPVRKSAELQKRFSAVASHELKTPLAIIKNTVEVALRKKDKLTLEKAIEILESNKEEVERLVNITEFLMTFSKLKAMKGKFPKNPVSLPAVADRAIKFIRNYGTRQADIELKVTGKGMILGDTTSLKLVLINLLKNAVTHTPPSGKIWVEITETDAWVVLSVCDTGTGISSDDIPYIFEPFYSGHRGDYDLGYGGVGLGLSIVKEIVLLHDAIIALEKTSKNGTVFKITFDKFDPKN